MILLHVTVWHGSWGIGPAEHLKKKSPHQYIRLTQGSCIVVHKNLVNQLLENTWRWVHATCFPRFCAPLYKLLEKLKRPLLAPLLETFCPRCFKYQRFFKSIEFPPSTPLQHVLHRHCEKNVCENLPGKRKKKYLCIYAIWMLIDVIPLLFLKLLTRTFHVQSINKWRVIIT